MFRKKLGADKQLENNIKALRKEQDVLSNSINGLKEERNLLENKNKFLKDEIVKKEIPSKHAGTIEKAAINNANIAIERAKIEQDNLNEIISQKEKASLILSGINSTISEMQKVYEENKKSSDKQIGQLAGRLEAKKIDAEKEFAKFSEEKEKEKIIVQEKLTQLKKQDGWLQATVSSLIVGEQDLRQNVAELEKEKEKMDNFIQQGNETSLNLIGKNENIENLIKSNGIILGSINEDLKKTKEELRLNKIELDKVNKRIGFVLSKEESFKGVDQYFKEVADKYGLDYQSPYEG